MLFVGPSGCLDDSQLDGDERLDDQVLRCNTSDYVIYDYQPPRVANAREQAFDPDKPPARRV